MKYSIKRTYAEIQSMYTTAKQDNEIVLTRAEAEDIFKQVLLEKISSQAFLSINRMKEQNQIVLPKDLSAEDAAYGVAQIWLQENSNIWFIHPSDVYDTVRMIEGVQVF